MLDSKILITLAGLLASVYAVNAIQNKKDDVKENFGMLPSFSLKVDRQVAPNRKAARHGNFTSIQNNYSSMLQPNPRKAFYTVPGNFQSKISPRMFGGDYGANITYNLPSKENLAVPDSPLDFANAVSKENFAPASCGTGGEPLDYHGGAPLMQAGYAAGDYNEVLDKAYNGPNVTKFSHANLPVGDMTTMNSLGEEDQPIVYDRYLFANRNSRLKSQGDFFRGDLPIVPINNGWFNPSVQPNVDLQQGAMNVMAGVNNETSQQLADLIYTTSGNYKTTIGGVNMQNELGNPAKTRYSSTRNNSLSRTNMGNQYKTNLSAGKGDVQVTVFP